MSNQSYWSKINPTAISKFSNSQETSIKGLKFSKCRMCEGRGYYSSLTAPDKITNEDIVNFKSILNKLFINSDSPTFVLKEDTTLRKVNLFNNNWEDLKFNILTKLKPFVCPTCHGSGGKFKNVLKLHKAIKNFGFLGNFKYMNPTDPNLDYIKDYITYEGWSGVMPVYEMKETIDEINYSNLFYGLEDNLIYGKWEELVEKVKINQGGTWHASDGTQWSGEPKDADAFRLSCPQGLRLRKNLMDASKSDEKPILFVIVNPAHAHIVITYQGMCYSVGYANIPDATDRQDLVDTWLIKPYTQTDLEKIAKIAEKVPEDKGKEDWLKKVSRIKNSWTLSIARKINELVEGIQLQRGVVCSSDFSMPGNIHEGKIIWVDYLTQQIADRLNKFLINTYQIEFESKYIYGINAEEINGELVDNKTVSNQTLLYNNNIIYQKSAQHTTANPTGKETYNCISWASHIVGDKLFNCTVGQVPGLCVGMNDDQFKRLVRGQTKARLIENIAQEEEEDNLTVNFIKQRLVDDRMSRVGRDTNIEAFYNSLNNDELGKIQKELELSSAESVAVSAVQNRSGLAAACSGMLATACMATYGVDEITALGMGALGAGALGYAASEGVNKLGNKIIGSKGGRKTRNNRNRNRKITQKIVNKNKVSRRKRKRKLHTRRKI